MLELDEIECNIDEDVDNEKYYQGKNSIHSSFINKLKDFSTFNPSGNKGKEKVPNSVLRASSRGTTHHKEACLPSINRNETEVVEQILNT